MNSLSLTIKKILSNYPPLLKLILILKKNKLFKNTKIKKLDNKTIIISTDNYNTFSLLNTNKSQILNYINNILKQINYNLTIENIKIINTPPSIKTTTPKTNQELLKKIKEIKGKLYGY